MWGIYFTISRPLDGKRPRTFSGKFGTKGWGEESRYDGKYDSEGRRHGQGPIYIICLVYIFFLRGHTTTQTYIYIYTSKYNSCTKSCISFVFISLQVRKRGKMESHIQVSCVRKPVKFQTWLSPWTLSLSLALSWSLFLIRTLALVSCIGSWLANLKNGLGEWKSGNIRYEGQWASLSEILSAFMSIVFLQYQIYLLFLFMQFRFLGRQFETWMGHLRIPRY